MPNINYILRDLEDIKFDFTDNAELDSLLTKAYVVWAEHRSHVSRPTSNAVDQVITDAINEAMDEEKKDAKKAKKKSK